MFAYADAQRDQRLAEPTDDVLQALTIAQSEGVLTEAEFHNYFGVLMIAGNETTRHTISHGMLALMDHPEQLQLLRDQPELIPKATEEILRWASPMHFLRPRPDFELVASRSGMATRSSLVPSANLDESSSPTRTRST